MQTLSKMALSDQTGVIGLTSLYISYQPNATLTCSLAGGHWE